ncbi:E3 ubiquitin-protein ligase BRE1B-like [Huso huso]|uniref:E3 ubiquitin protein ligase n=1 Tax=Huso huso TaxID=61971 RepID=A0ABR0Y532_HUSHU
MERRRGGRGEGRERRGERGEERGDGEGGERNQRGERRGGIRGCSGKRGEREETEERGEERERGERRGRRGGEEGRRRGREEGGERRRRTEQGRERGGRERGERRRERERRRREKGEERGEEGEGGEGRGGRGERRERRRQGNSDRDNTGLHGDSHIRRPPWLRVPPLNFRSSAVHIRACCFLFASTYEREIEKARGEKIVKRVCREAKELPAVPLRAPGGSSETMSAVGAGKRASQGGDSPSGPPEKKGKREEKSTTTLIEPISLGRVCSTVSLARCGQLGGDGPEGAAVQKQEAGGETGAEAGHRGRLREDERRLEKRQATDDATLLIVNRYWSQLDENVQILLQRYDPELPPAPAPAEAELEEGGEDAGALPSSPPVPADLPEPALSFLATLASSSSEEIELQLQDRMGFSKRAVSHIVRVFERLHHRIEGLCERVRCAANQDDAGTEALSLNRELCEENHRLQDLATQLQEKHHKMSLEYNELVDKVTSSERKVSEMETNIEDLQWDIEPSAEERAETEQASGRGTGAVGLDLLNSGYYTLGNSGALQGGQITLNMQKFENKAGAESGLANTRWQAGGCSKTCSRGCEKPTEGVVMDLHNIPEEVVKETPEYRCLQSQFSLLYSESLQVKTQLDEARALLLSTKNTHLRQIEHMESDELSLQKKLRTEVIQLEDTLAQVRKEYEMLRIEFEQNLAANEQAGPINREMRHLISSLQNHSHQLKGDVLRYKRKLRETHAEICKVHWGEEGENKPPGIKKEVKEEPVEVKKEKEEEERVREKEREEREREREKEAEREREKEKEKEREKERQRSEEMKKKDSDALKLVRTELKKAQESQKEMKLLLDMYKSAPKEQRDKVQLMAAERKAKAEVEELRQRVRELEEKERKESKKLADEDALRKIKLAEEQIEHLQKKLTATKQEEEALLSEMDVTGQAFEDMQEQNIRLMQQLREKDDANFKLMSERIKSNQIYKLLREEKDELGDQVLTLKTQVDAQLLVVQKLEEKEGVLQSNLSTIEKELGLRTQALELNKRKAVEAAQLAEDLKVQLEHTQNKLREIQSSMSHNRSAREGESFNLKRAQEDLSRLRRRLEKQKKVEVYTDADEILQEEINQYKVGEERLSHCTLTQRERETGNTSF